MKSPNSMRFLKFGASLILLLLFLYVGGTHGLGGPQVPAVAKLLNPFTGVWQQAEAINQDLQRVVVPGAAQGKVVVDERGIPHIFADKLVDAIFMQGYMHAKDRLFQMDISVRATEGRLAEVLGPNLVERDQLQRRKGMKIAARRAAKAWLDNPETKPVVEAYVAGVNTYLAELTPAAYPVEYKLLGFEPEPWSVYKSAVFSKSMAETLCFRNRDVATTNIRTTLGDSLFAHLYPQYNPKQSPVVSQERWLATEEAPTATEGLSGLFPFPDLPQSPEGIGSNNWAVAGSKTASGSPLLSNDPHLSLTLPSIWYEMHLIAGEYNVYGVSLPALPSILIGFNENTAWGITNVGQDVLDWYRIEWADEAQTTYKLDGEAVPVEEVVDTVWVRGENDPIIVRTPWTIFGPVVYDQPENAYYNLAMRWVAHDPPYRPNGDNVKAFLDMAKATTLDGYIEALQPFDNPGSNVVYANQANDIALTVTGRFPIRAEQQGRFVQDGTTRENLWTGFIPYEEIPRDINPERQFVASANQRSAGLSYPYYYLGSFDDYRGRYINRRLEALEDVTPEDLMALQWDSYSLKAEEALPVMLGLLEGTTVADELQSGLELLQQWDYRYTAEAKAPVLFNSWLDSLYRLTFDEVFSRDKEDYPILYPETWRFIELLDESPNDLVFDQQQTAAIETAADLVRTSYEQAAAEVLPLLDEGTDWNAHRGTRIQHLARIPGFDSGILTTDGTRDTPNALSSGFGPSWRMVVSLEQPLRAWGVLPGGSSGSVGSQFYMEGVEEWSKGEYFELQLYKTPEEVPAAVHLEFGE